MYLWLLDFDKMHLMIDRSLVIHKSPDPTEIRSEQQNEWWDCSCDGTCYQVK